jgi:hypothetical protein
MERKRDFPTVEYENDPRFAEAAGYLSNWARELKPYPFKRSAPKSSDLYLNYCQYVNRSGGVYVLSPEWWGKIMSEEQGYPPVDYHGARKRLATMPDLNKIFDEDK